MGYTGAGKATGGKSTPSPCRRRSGWTRTTNCMRRGCAQGILAEPCNPLTRQVEQLGRGYAPHSRRQIMLQVLDTLWKEHLPRWTTAPGHPPARLRAEKSQAGIQARVLRVVRTCSNLKYEVVKFLSPVQVRAMRQNNGGSRGAAPLPRPHAIGIPAASALPLREHSRWSSHSQRPCRAACATYTCEGPKLGRNEPCPCGSGKKYKQCHGRLE
jgi:preprotein translocase subunit SecA